mmetsp:Transcript_54439/g.167602  ORF Transcript_54439/g.167602 Transcript_54439/m.167602 type:complete len:239 (-) Transcript_54439:362-1078(-)
MSIQASWSSGSSRSASAKQSICDRCHSLISIAPPVGIARARWCQYAPSSGSSVTARLMQSMASTSVTSASPMPPAIVTSHVEPAPRALSSIPRPSHAPARPPLMRSAARYASSARIATSLTSTVRGGSSPAPSVRERSSAASETHASAHSMSSSTARTKQSSGRYVRPLCFTAVAPSPVSLERISRSPSASHADAFASSMARDWMMHWRRVNSPALLPTRTLVLSRGIAFARSSHALA